MLQALRTFFANPSRQAAAWTGVGIIGVLLAVTGVYFLLDDDPVSSSPRLFEAGETATTKPTETPTASPTATATPAGQTATAFARSEMRTQTALAGTPSATTTPVPAATQQQSFIPAEPEDTPTPEPPTPTPTPTVPNLAYCDSIGGGGTPPSAIFGTVTVDGEAAPPGTIVTIAFSGVPSLSAPVTVDGVAAGYRFLYGAGGGGCSNQLGASIEVIVNGQSFTAPALVGGAEALRFDVATG
jgi:hypothetical protein